MCQPTLSISPPFVPIRFLSVAIKTPTSSISALFPPIYSYQIHLASYRDARMFHLGLPPPFSPHEVPVFFPIKTPVLSSYTQVSYPVIHDSGSVPDKIIFSPAGISPAAHNRANVMNKENLSANQLWVYHPLPKCGVPRHAENKWIRKRKKCEAVPRKAHT